MTPDTFFANLSVQLMYHGEWDMSHQTLVHEWPRYSEGIYFERDMEKMLNEHRPRFLENNQVVYDLLKRWKEEGSPYLKDVALPEPYNPYHVLLVAFHRWYCEISKAGAFKPDSDFFAKIKKNFSVTFRDDLRRKYATLSKGVDTWMELVPVGKEIFGAVYKQQAASHEMTPETFVKEIKNPWSATTKLICSTLEAKFAHNSDPKLEAMLESWFAGFLVRFWDKGSDNCPVMLSFSFDRFYDAEGHRWSSYEQFIWGAIEKHRAAKDFVPLLVFYIRVCFDMGFYTLEDVKMADQIPAVFETMLTNFQA